MGSTDHERAILKESGYHLITVVMKTRVQQAGGVKQATILEAEGKAEAIRLVNEAAKQYFTGSAITLR